MKSKVAQKFIKEYKGYKLYLMSSNGRYWIESDKIEKFTADDSVRNVFERQIHAEKFIDKKFESLK